jgi:hypothetical protein
MSATERLIQRACRLHAGLFDHRQQPADLLHVIAMLDLKRGQ